MWKRTAEAWMNGYEENEETSRLLKACCVVVLCFGDNKGAS